eukprot:TRINITY_DN14581_c0_g1_i1.p2 TRINITY_DN14581_c0_g1~~TRINITY_DN14581_c0_g1_i1.p2  ORF type:complete len:169 (+),score=46.88 TRINITY_DN14581_c0_g1_i1:184-690(+)
MLKAFVDERRGAEKMGESHYPRVEIKSKPGQSYPVVYWLDQSNRVIREAMRFKGKETPEHFPGLFDMKGVGRLASPPEWTPPVFEPTPHCLGWRANSFKGERTHETYEYDLPCDEWVTVAHPGECECTEGRTVAVGFAGGRPRFQCEDKCAELFAGGGDARAEEGEEL